MPLGLALAAAISTGAQSAPADSQTGASRVALAIVADPRSPPVVHLSADRFVIQEPGAAREVFRLRPGD